MLTLRQSDAKDKFQWKKNKNTVIFFQKIFFAKCISFAKCRRFVLALTCPHTDVGINMAARDR